MGQGRRHFTDEFKQEAIALLVSSGRPLSQIASELGISPRFGDRAKADVSRIHPAPMGRAGEPL
jgi:transposase